MPSTSPMPPKNLAAVRISDRSTETQTQTDYPPSMGSGGLMPRSPVLALGSSCCAPDARSAPSSRQPAVLDEPRRVASPDHSADCRFVAHSALATRLLLSTRFGSDDGCERCPCRRESRAARTGQRSTCCSPTGGPSRVKLRPALRQARRGKRPSRSGRRHRCIAASGAKTPGGCFDAGASESGLLDGRPPRRRRNHLAHRDAAAPFTRTHKQGAPAPQGESRSRQSAGRAVDSQPVTRPQRARSSQAPDTERVVALRLWG
jgi:hypothetical protein